MDSEIKQMCQHKITTVMLGRRAGKRVQLCGGARPTNRLKEKQPVKAPPTTMPPQTFKLPLGFIVTFRWSEGKWSVEWDPRTPTGIRSPRHRRKLLEAYQTARTEYFQAIATGWQAEPKRKRGRSRCQTLKHAGELHLVHLARIWKRVKCTSSAFTLS
jgi:hypothetical protein